MRYPNSGPIPKPIGSLRHYGAEPAQRNAAGVKRSGGCLMGWQSGQPRPSQSVRREAAEGRLVLARVDAGGPEGGRASGRS